jgi:SsrA-binding protein
MYFKNRIAKLEVGICRGKDQHDKRQDILVRDAKMEMARAAKAHR